MGIEIGFFVGAVVLGAALAWGAFQYSRRNRANEPVTDAATRASYQDPDGYARETEGEMRSKVKPS